MNVDIIYKKETKEPLSMVFEATNDVDRALISRLWKAMLFDDAIGIDNGDGTEFVYKSGATQKVIDGIITETA